MLKKLIVSFFIVIMPCTFCACGNAYNATVFNIGVSDLNEDFVHSNKVQDLLSSYCGLPNDRTIVIDNEEKYRSTFKTTDIDIDSQMLIIYTYCSIAKGNMIIKKISESEDHLDIQLEDEKVADGVGSAVSPYQRYVVVKLDKLDISDVKVIVN